MADNTFHNRSYSFPSFHSPTLKHSFSFNRTSPKSFSSKWNDAVKLCLILVYNELLDDIELYTEISNTIEVYQQAMERNCLEIPNKSHIKLFQELYQLSQTIPDIQTCCYDIEKYRNSLEIPIQEENFKYFVCEVIGFPDKDSENDEQFMWLMNARLNAKRMHTTLNKKIVRCKLQLVSSYKLYEDKRKETFDDFGVTSDSWFYRLLYPDFFISIDQRLSLYKNIIVRRIEYIEHNCLSELLKELERQNKILSLSGGFGTMTKDDVLQFDPTLKENEFRYWPFKF